MFTPLIMQRATIYLVKEEAPDAALAFGRCGLFEPEYGDDAELIPEGLGSTFRDTFDTATNRLTKTSAHLGVSISDLGQSTARLVSQSELEALNDKLGELWQNCSRREEQARHIRDELRAVEQLEHALDVYEPLDFDLSIFHEGFRFLDVRIGVVPIAHLERLREAVGLLGYTTSEFSRAENAAHVLLVGLSGKAPALERVLGAASFNELKIPEDFAAHPRRVRRDLDERRTSLLGEMQEIEDAIQTIAEEQDEYLRDAAVVLAMASPYARIAEMMQRCGGLARVTGWVPRDRVAQLQEQLHKNLDNRFVLELRDPLPEERGNVPSALRHPRLLKPFAALVRNYGVPRYGEVDPTWLFAISFIAMFGMMFGDIGHGLLIATAGLFARRKLRGFAPFVVALGLSSTLFGFLYGSLFGYEELIHPLWIAPLTDPTLMLKLALYWGIAFIIIMTLIQIRNRVREGAISEAMLSGKGLAGAVFYLGLIFAGGRWLQDGIFGATGLAAVLAPLAVILAYQWRQVHAPIGEKIVVVFIEGFETLLGFVANTLSFLRVAAFSLNHVALAIAVFTIANMLGPTGHWIAVVLGNIFILVLEGAIVTIQVLRLEYYEGFSRFFNGDGREFRPLTVGMNN
jgi:V/A-type H+-transporting ATPase subunit I